MPFKPADALHATQVRLRELARVHRGLIHEALADFYEETGIKGKHDGALCILDYDALKVKWAEPYGYCCRGLILDPFNDWAVVSFGLDKFFNDGDFYAAPVDWDNTFIFEKCDGSMVQRFWNPYTAKFEYSTRLQLPSAMRVNMTNAGITWQELVERCVGDFIFDQPQDETWVLEVMSLVNKVVVGHPEPHFKLLAIRNNGTLAERHVPPTHPKRPFSASLKNAEETHAVADSMPGTECEGFVVCDRNFNRVKVKNINYVALHRLKDGINSVGAIINIAKGGDFDDIVAKLPEYRRAIEVADAAIKSLVLKHDLTYHMLKDIPSQKDFALKVQELGLEAPSTLFLTRAGKQASIRDAFDAMRENAFIEVIKSALPADFIKLCYLPPVSELPSP